MPRRDRINPQDLTKYYVRAGNGDMVPLSTLATIKRETGSWKQMAFATVYLFAAAYLAALVTYQVAVALGAG